MTNRQRTLAVLRYQSYDRLPLVHFGFWNETLDKWAAEGHISVEEAKNWGDGTPTDAVISKKLGFDFNYACCFGPSSGLNPGFEPKVIETLPDGSQHMLNGEGVVVLQKPDAGSIPTEIKHTLVDRASWEEHYKWRYQFNEDRIKKIWLRVNDVWKPFDEGGLDFLKKDERDYPYGLFCGSLYGQIRNILGVEGSCYLMMDDEDLFDEIIETVGSLSFQVVEYTLKSGAKFDFAHFWEDICFKNGPLISPSVFDEKVGPQYKRITDLLKQYGIDIVSLDCDGKIDALIPTWFKNGVNTMFPIEVGTWNASIKPWREMYGKDLRGVGGMDKKVFAYDREAIDTEIERLKPLVDLGGFIPCPDHRIAPDAKWDLVLYYADRMHETFGK
jgi:uroporphyrinogen decarboxylase